ncbi:hypothetical protein WMY93_026672 [Mugilogobius chulae]|uniref:Uncharacterized protein n=1 Tax=Mugilogobius chulae TaxID=88201 RepID=A0AAW0N8I4_9GOBI
MERVLSADLTLQTCMMESAIEDEEREQSHRKDCLKAVHFTHSKLQPTQQV